MRFFICDDSGSMMTADGNRMVANLARPGEAAHFECTRWEELGATVQFHAALAQASGSHCEFSFLNGPSIELPKDGPGGFQTLQWVLQQAPNGRTPLCAAVRRIIAKITSMAPTLRENGQQAVLTIVTDGEASDGQLAEAMQPLQQLPVWVVVRLSTDEEPVVNYWNNIENDLELNLDVLDDVASEAQEVREYNPFLNYAEPLHRMREWGMHLKALHPNTKA